MVPNEVSDLAFILQSQLRKRGEIITSSKLYSNGFYKVYVHTNLTNGKRYVGITSQKPEYRWNYGRSYKCNPHFWSAICKYGWDGFSHEVLYDHLTEDEAKSIEIKLIAQWNTQDSRCGYNVSAGGEGTHGYHPSEEWKKNNSELHKGRKRSPETVEKLRAASKRNYEKTRDALILSRHVPVNMYTLEGVLVASYSSIVEAASANGFTDAQRKKITAVCRGERKSVGGYKWEYAK